MDICIHCGKGTKWNPIIGWVHGKGFGSVFCGTEESNIATPAGA